MKLVKALSYLIIINKINYMTKQTVLRKMLPVVLMLLGTTAIAQESGKLPVISGQINTNQRTVSQQPPSKAQLVVQPPNGHVANKDAAPLIAVADVLVNNNSGAGTTSGFTQSETSVIAFGNNVVIGFNDAGSFGGVNNKFTGWSYSSDGGATFTDGGSLPTNAVGDAGDPVLARNNTTGRIYLLTLGFNSPYLIQVFHSDNNGITWSLPTSATPGGNDEDKAWITVDNFAGGGNGNVYLLSRRFGGAVAQRGIYFFSSTDNGATFSPTGGSLIASGASGNVQGAYLAVGPDHSLHAIWYDDVTNDLKARRSTDFGATWSAPVTK